jgi:hypothetical protein
MEKEKEEGLGKLALVLFPLFVWLGAGFLAFPRKLERLALEMNEQIVLPPLEKICILLGGIVLFISLIFLTIWLRSRTREF